MADLPGLTDVIERVTENVFGIRFRDEYSTEVNRAVERVLVDRLLLLAARAPMAQVRAESALALRRLRQRVMEGSGTPDWPQDAHYSLLCEDIRRFLERPHESIANPPPRRPSRQPHRRSRPAVDRLGLGVDIQPMGKLRLVVAGVGARNGW